jgi:hypothetical protein
MTIPAPATAALGLLLAAGAAAAQVDLMAEQRCVWSCLANSPGAASREYSDCVARLCTATGPAGVGLEAAASAPLSPSASPRPRPRASAAPAEARATSPAAAAAPPAPATADGAAPGWSWGPAADGAGMFAGVRDDATGARLDWRCAKGRGSVLALTPFSGGETVTVSVAGRTQDFEVRVENGTAYAPVSFSAPIFLHIASGQEVAFLAADGTVIGSFAMEGAPLAIGQAEGRCR